MSAFGFARTEAETPSGEHPIALWGSTRFALPEDTQQTPVRLQAEDYGASQGILYRRGGEKTAVVFNHPRAGFPSHYLTPFLLEAGYGVFGAMTRNYNNDINCIHEHLIADLAAQIGYLHKQGIENVVLLGNSGGGSLSTFYQAQANTNPPDRLTDTAAGDPYDLNTLDLPPADGLILFAAHVGEGVFGLENLDPSVIDENDPLSCDPALDMYNPANGYREPPEVSSYSPEFLERYRAAQRARCERLDAMARQIIERKRRYRAQMDDPKFPELPFEERIYITRMATASQYLNIARVGANPAYTDLSINPSTRVISSLLHPDPHIGNWMLGGFSSVMTPEGWLSTWSGLSSRAAALENIKKVDQPVLVVSFTADAGILPHEAQGMFDNAAAKDKKLVHVDADHYAHTRTEPIDDPIIEGAEHVTSWLKERFPAA
jgi:pimeloyl-ACP methyl ester carboxylesterase